ncbi:2-dehydro-3-deoxygalactonokinase [Treponema parvum]|uniref:2-dehydro-3-deoxygalactonokinase n=1 Tax=Treponema parvum TaxID=138851 RepID=A0A975F1G6_9SPIR|nr:2-dehydro-3-deoxygalactonokinase [Treponema parvum]QTQ12339.1 2-dehydro-3-deoxygalactonokinase [Treponema parvum]
MYDFYFDSGTTNTRMYVFNGKEEPVYKAEKSVGSKDSALSGDKDLLPRELHLLLEKGCAELKIGRESVGEIWMSGMITSPNGIVEVPHITVPVDLNKLARNVFVFDEKKFFKKEIHFIPGIKSFPAEGKITAENVDSINNMRGEETEICGIMSSFPASNSASALKGNFIFVLPGSHTQVAAVKDGSIVNIVSTITGELFKALKSQTILASALEGGYEKIDTEMVRLGYRNLQKYGFNRAIYIDRSLLLFTDSTAEQRHSYLEGVLNGGVLQAVSAAFGGKPDKNPKTQNKAEDKNRTLKKLGEPIDMYICGSENQFQIYKAIAEDSFPEYSVKRMECGSIPFSALGYKAVFAAYKTIR